MLILSPKGNFLKGPRRFIYDSRWGKKLECREIITNAWRKSVEGSLAFKDHWEVVGDDIIRTVQAFHHSGRLLQKVNHTHIVLIPKVKALRKMTELRPISLCNVVYKIIAKVLTNRLKNVMDRGVEGKEGQMAVKLDMAKAYDQVEWSFLIEVIRKTLSAYIRKNEMERQISGVRVAPGANAISHLSFVDDSMVFCKADETEVDFGHSKKAVFESVRHGIESCIDGWAEQFLSPAGKEILIKSVAMAMPNHAMACFKLPVTTCKEMERVIAQFW
ncbi:uncharacterized protein [Pyrus communis]|uniref:uncharacterized protein n=1 Tax=Pyrus communis TaxID=23211 RepID=UPI0035C00CC8